MQKKFFISFFILFFWAMPIYAQVLTHVLPKGEVQFVSGYLFIKRDMKFTGIEIDEDDKNTDTVNYINENTSYQVENSVFFIGMNFGFSSYIQLHMGVGLNSQKFSWNDKSGAYWDIPPKKIHVAMVRFGLGGGYEFKNGILVAEQSSVAFGSLPDMDNLPHFRQKDIGYWGEWDVALSGGYRIKFSPQINALPYVGIIYSNRYEYMKGTIPKEDEKKLEWSVMGKDKFGGVIGLSFNYKSWEWRFEADLGTRRYYVAQVGVRI